MAAVPRRWCISMMQAILFPPNPDRQLSQISRNSSAFSELIPRLIGWLKVNIESLRRHLIDSNYVTLAEVGRGEPPESGAALTVLPLPTRLASYAVSASSA